ncbi:alpha/beta hydrolase [Streptomyces violascens]|uniref:alpha/beta hydrolase n=1 Tax=Streptomyces violascens TaxID=67381 RepID=UPI003788C676
MLSSAVAAGPSRITAGPSDDDPYCDLKTATSFVRDWQAQHHPVESCGHIHADRGLGDWPTGLQLLRRPVDQ